MLIRFLDFADPIYWGENEITDRKQCIDLFLTSQIPTKETEQPKFNNQDIIDYIISLDIEGNGVLENARALQEIQGYFKKFSLLKETGSVTSCDTVQPKTTLMDDEIRQKLIAYDKFMSTHDFNGRLLSPGRQWMSF